MGAALALAAASVEFQPIRERLGALGVGETTLHAVVRRVSHGPDDQREMIALRARVLAGLGDTLPGLVEQYALLRTAAAALEAVPALRVPEAVKQLLLEEFTWFTEPRERERAWFVAGTYEFSALCKLATLRRFPAGQMHWEVAGLSRSTLFKVRLRDVPRFVKGVVQLGGFRPAVMPHLAFRRRHIVLSEREHYRSLALMAHTLELQPQLLGFVAEAWFYSPDTVAASPHLAWAPRLFREWGGAVFITGQAGSESGVFQSARTRERLAQEGVFRPTLGLVLWPRQAMLQWAGQHAESLQAVTA